MYELKETVSTNLNILHLCNTTEQYHNNFSTAVRCHHIQLFSEIDYMPDKARKCLQIIIPQPTALKPLFKSI